MCADNERTVDHNHKTVSRRPELCMLLMLSDGFEKLTTTYC